MTKTVPRLFIGLDLGTSSLKGLALDETGAEVCSAEASYPTYRPAPGRAEQLPSDWTAAVRRVLSELAARAPVARWAGVGLSGMIPTLVTLNRLGEPNGNALTWEDSRARAQADELRTRIGPDRLYRLVGQWVDARYLVPMYRWIVERDGGRAASTAHLLSAKDYLFSWLTDELATDPSTAAGYGCLELEPSTWSDEVLSLVGLASPRPGRGDHHPPLPAVRPPNWWAPVSTERARELGVPTALPVCLGAADSVLAAFAMGVNDPGGVAYVSGTSTVIVGVSDRLIFDRGHRYLVTPMVSDHIWGFEMDLVSTGGAFRWLAEMLGLEAASGGSLMHLAQASEAGAGGISFLPYVGFGEQGALWNESLRGSVAGLSLTHGPADLARALIDGVVLESRRCLSVLDEAGVSHGEIRMTGRGAEPTFFRQAIADATGREVAIVGGPEWMASAYGAAALAARAILGPQPERRAPEVLDRVVPRKGESRRWERLWERHERLRSALTPVYASDMG